MAFPASNKGTLVPGQKISVNNYTVQVEKYLSQGFAFTPTSVDFGNVALVRWICTCLPRQDSRARVRNNTPCPQTYRSSERVDAHRG